MEKLPGHKRRTLISTYYIDGNHQKKIAYGCTNFLPSTYPKGEDIETLVIKQDWLKNEYQKPIKDRNLSQVLLYMNATYLLQRQMVY